jgi:hypothetical protein
MKPIPPFCVVWPRKPIILYYVFSFNLLSWASMLLVGCHYYHSGSPLQSFPLFCMCPTAWFLLECECFLFPLVYVCTFRFTFLHYGRVYFCNTKRWDSIATTRWGTTPKYEEVGTKLGSNEIINLAKNQNFCNIYTNAKWVWKVFWGCSSNIILLKKRIVKPIVTQFDAWFNKHLQLDNKSSQTS